MTVKEHCKKRKDGRTKEGIEWEKRWVKDPFAFK